MESPVVRVIMIAVGVAAAGAVAAILWAQLNTSSAKIKDTPLVDYGAITTQVICEGAGGTWTAGNTPPCAE